MATSATQNDKTMQKSQQKIAFSDLLDRFMEERPNGLAKTSVESYKYGIKTFKNWLDQEGHSLHELGPFTVGDFWVWLRDENDYADPTLESYTKAVRTFLEFAEGYDVVQQDLHKNIENFHADKEARQWDQEVDTERIDEILEVLETYAPRRNPLIFRLLAETGLRRSGLRALDVNDVQFTGGPVLDVRNRDNTKLKGRGDHERVINISQDLYSDLQAYVTGSGEHGRIDVEDDYGRKPLFTTKNGRASMGLIVDTVRYYSCPAITGVGDCDCINPNKHDTKDCEKSFAPHTLRKHHVTKLRNNGIGFESIGERVACNPDTLRDHYDRSTKEQQAERRKETLADFL